VSYQQRKTYLKKWREKNPEKIREYKRTQYWNDPEKYRRIQREKYAKYAKTHFSKIAYYCEKCKEFTDADHPCFGGNLRYKYRWYPPGYYSADRK